MISCDIVAIPNPDSLPSTLALDTWINSHALLVDSKTCLFVPGPRLLMIGGRDFGVSERFFRVATPISDPYYVRVGASPSTPASSQMLWDLRVTLYSSPPSSSRVNHTSNLWAWLRGIRTNLKSLRNSAERSCAGPTVCIGYDRKLYCRPTDPVSPGTLPTPYRLYLPYVTRYNKEGYPTEFFFLNLGHNLAICRGAVARFLTAPGILRICDNRHLLL